MSPTSPLSSSLPYTYEAYASAVSEVLSVLSSSVLRIEAKVAAQADTYTLLDFFRDLEPWMGQGRLEPFLH